MCIESGGISTGRRVFDRLIKQSANSWTSLIQACISQREFQRSLCLFESMREGGILPTKHTLQTMLKACARLKLIGHGRRLHCEIVKKGFNIDPFVGSSLLDMYAKTSLPNEARIVFDKLAVRDVVVWTALIQGYSENGLDKEAVGVFKKMQEECVVPNCVTFICTLKACGNLGCIISGQEIHIEIIKEGLEQDSFVGSALVYMYCTCDLIIEARNVFDGLRCRDVVLWTAIIGGYFNHGFMKEATDCLEMMQLDGISLNAVTSICCLKAWARLGSVEKGKSLHSQIIKMGFDDDKDDFVNTALVDMYAKCGSLLEAKYMFHNLDVRGLVSWNALIGGFAEYNHGKEAIKYLEEMQTKGTFPDTITYVCALKACGSTVGLIEEAQKLHTEIAKDGLEEDPCIGISLLDMYAKCGFLREAQDVFNELSSQDVVSWNVLISAYVDHGLAQEAMECMEKMYDEGSIPLDAITTTCSLKACISVGDFDRGRWIHSQTIKQGLIQADPMVGISLVEMYAKCNSLDEAKAVFDVFRDQTVIMWGTLLWGYACQGESERVFHLYNQMVEEGVYPDNISFLSLLSVCSHAGLMNEALKSIISMGEGYGLASNIEHYNCIIDLLCRAGLLAKATIVMERMPFQPNSVTWCTILGACRKTGDIALARHAFECATNLNDREGASFILMASIYADNHLWDDIEELESLIERNKTDYSN